jgi:hypothetical protein
MSDGRPASRLLSSQVEKYRPFAAVRIALQHLAQNPAKP